MNIKELFNIGLSRSKSRFIINPIRWLLFPIVRPYFHALLDVVIKDIEKRLAMLSDLKDERREGELKNLHDQLSANTKDLTAITSRLNTIEGVRASNYNRLENISSLREEHSPKITFVQAQLAVEVSKDSLGEVNFNHHGHRTSYSQVGEDVIVAYLFERLDLDLSKASYLDLGAANPIGHNNTYFIYQGGGSGLLVEADPCYFESYNLLRPRDLAIQAAIIPSRIKFEEMVDFYRTTDPGWSTVSEEHLALAKKQGKDSKEISKIRVPALTINELLKEHFSTRVMDLLSIDIESVGTEVVQEINFDLYRPKVIIFENEFNAEQNTFSNLIQAELASRGYVLYASTYVNSIFVLKELIPLIKF